MEPMSLGSWVALFAVSSLWWKWIISWGGAHWLEGIKSWFFLSCFAWSWNVEQIRLYAACCWILEGIWFAIGIFLPDVRLSL